MWQISYRPEGRFGITGAVMRSALESLRTCGYERIVTEGVEGGGAGIGQIRERQVVGLNELSDLLDDVVQIDWGDFYFFASEREVDDFELVGRYEELVTQTPLTIRVVDSAYLYIYCSDERVAQHCRSAFPGAECVEGDPSNLSFPE